VVIQGQVIETGLGFSLTVDYNRFREIFRKRTEEERDAQTLQEEQKLKDEQEKASQQKDKDDRTKTQTTTL
jgi:hypothetical protein